VGATETGPGGAWVSSAWNRSRNKSWGVRSSACVVPSRRVLSGRLARRSDNNEVGRVTIKDDARRQQPPAQDHKVAFVPVLGFSGKALRLRRSWILGQCFALPTSKLGLFSRDCYLSTVFFRYATKLRNEADSQHE